jgi:hypothetical protein
MQVLLLLLLAFPGIRTLLMLTMNKRWIQNARRKAGQKEKDLLNLSCPFAED